MKGGKIAFSDFFLLKKFILETIDLKLWCPLHEIYFLSIIIKTMNNWFFV